jgi:hypothetical protein
LHLRRWGVIDCSIRYACVAELLKQLAVLHLDISRDHRLVCLRRTLLGGFFFLSQGVCYFYKFTIRPKPLRLNCFETEGSDFIS